MAGPVRRTIRKETEKNETGDKLYFANRLRIQKNPSSRIWVQGKPLSDASFDILSIGVGRPRTEVASLFPPLQTDKSGTG